jgi:hypothetical protein
MQKIPAGDSIAFGYRFLFGQIGTVVRAAGLPAIVYASADYAARAYAAMQPVPEPGSPPGPDVIAVGALAFFIEVFAGSAAAIAMTRAVFAERGIEPRLPFASSVVRMAGANMRFIAGTAVLVMFATLISIIGLGLAGFDPESDASFEPTLSVFVAMFLSWGLFLYAFVSMVRMGFFLAPVVAVERKGGLIRSHELTKGNVWRAIAVSFALGLPVALIAFLAAVAVVQSAFGGEPITPGPEAVRRLQQAVADNLLVWEALTAVIFVFYAGLIYSGVAFAYAAIAPRDPPVL